MIDIGDWSRINQLINERQSIVDGLAAFDAEGTRIDSMTLTGPNTSPPNISIRVDTSYMAYMPQMVDSIKGFMGERLDEIAKTLEGLGISGAAGHVALQAQPAPQTAPTTKRGARK